MYHMVQSMRQFMLSLSLHIQSNTFNVSMHSKIQLFLKYKNAYFGLNKSPTGSGLYVAPIVTVQLNTTPVGSDKVMSQTKCCSCTRFSVYHPLKLLGHFPKSEISKAIFICTAQLSTICYYIISKSPRVREMHHTVGSDNQLLYHL